VVLIVGYFYAIILFLLMWQCEIGGHKCDLLRTDRTEYILFPFYWRDTCNSLSINFFFLKKKNVGVNVFYLINNKGTILTQLFIYFLFKKTK
jgi:hypothetical protein